MTSIYSSPDSISKLEFYKTENNKIGESLGDASYFFNRFKAHPTIRNMQLSLNSLDLALKIAIDSGNELDEGHVLRRFSTTKIRDFRDRRRHTIITSSLNRSITIFTRYLNNNSLDFNIKLQNEQKVRSELKKSLELLCKVAFDRKNGSLLERKATALKILAEKEIMRANDINSPELEESSYDYLFKATRYLFHTNFAKGDFTTARKELEGSLKLAEQHNFDLHTEYRHMAKLRLIESGMKCSLEEFEAYIEASFWLSYDHHKNQFRALRRKGPFPKAAYHKLFKDLKFHFCMKLVKHRNDRNAFQEALDLTLREARRCRLSERNQKDLNEYCLDTFSKWQKNGCCLSPSLFIDLEF